MNVYFSKNENARGNVNLKSGNFDRFLTAFFRYTGVPDRVIFIHIEWKKINEKKKLN